MRRILLPALCALCLTACEESGPTVDPSTVSTDPPAGALVLEPVFTPHALLGEARHDPDTAGGYQDAWLSERGWEGEVLSVRKSGSMTLITLNMSHISVPGELHVVCETPDPGNVAKGGLARIRGRIDRLEMSSNPAFVGNRFFLDHCKVLSFMKPS
ncbi:MAG: hypothetical protein H6811_11375 [Phycisphaeraceae bacterium]|nr:hypothetical protein [Phycisphaeraceae bacterium]